MTDIIVEAQRAVIRQDWSEASRLYIEAARIAGNLSVKRPAKFNEAVSHLKDAAKYMHFMLRPK